MDANMTDNVNDLTSTEPPALPSDDGVSPPPPPLSEENPSFKKKKRLADEFLGPIPTKRRQPGNYPNKDSWLLKKKNLPQYKLFRGMVMSGPPTFFTRTPATDFYDVTKDRLYVVDDLLDAVALEGESLPKPPSLPPSDANHVMYLSQITKPELQESDKRVTVMDGKKQILLHKCSQTFCNKYAGSYPLKRWAYHRNTLALAQKWRQPHPFFEQYQHQSDVRFTSSTWMRFGGRPNFHNRRIGKYNPLQPDTPDEVKIEIEARIQELVKDVETLIKDIYLPDELKAMEMIRKEFNIGDAIMDANSSSSSSSSSQDSFATSLSVAQGFWTAARVVKEKFCYSAICCLASEHQTSESIEQVLCYVVLPSCDVAVPMFYGDVVVLDPTIPHCITKPRHKEVYTVMLDISAKTYMADIAQNYTEL